MNFASLPKPDCVLIATLQEAEELCTKAGGFMVPHKETLFVLVHGKWLMILPPEEKETETDERQESGRD